MNLSSLPGSKHNENLFASALSFVSPVARLGYPEASPNRQPGATP
jgi:hypothetical protein